MKRCTPLPSRRPNSVVLVLVMKWGGGKRGVERNGKEGVAGR